MDRKTFRFSGLYYKASEATLDALRATPAGDARREALAAGIASGEIVPQIHKFEKAGLGRAPFQYVGHSEAIYKACADAPAQPCGECDYCGNSGLRDLFWLKSADGRTFKVGSSCIHKSGDAGLARDISRDEKAAKRAHDRKLREARNARNAAELADLLDDPAIRAHLEAQPHPNEWRASEGDSALDGVEWRAKNSGAAGTWRLVKELRKVRESLGQ